MISPGLERGSEVHLIPVDRIGEDQGTVRLESLRIEYEELDAGFRF